MKKLTLLVALTITLVSKAQESTFHSLSCGWLFKSTTRAAVEKGVVTDIKKRDFDFYFNSDCNGSMKVVFPDGKTKNYQINATYETIESKTNNGTPYTLFFFNQVGSSIIQKVSVIRTEGTPTIRMFFGDNYVDFY
jgi:hypothetical protein